MEQPPVEVRRRSVRRSETSAPSVSVNTRTSVRRSQEEDLRGGVSVEQRTRIRSQSTDTSVSTRTNRDTSSEGSASGTSITATRSALEPGSTSNSTTSQPQR